MQEGGYDQKMNETVSVVTTKTTEIGQKTWGIMKGVMAMASQKVEEFTKEGSNWKADDRQQTNGLKNAYYQDFGGKGSSGGWPDEHSSGRYNSTSTWDDWDEKDRKVEPGKVRENGNDWAGWDDVKDEDSDEDKHRHSSSVNGLKSGSRWSDGGFH